MSDSICIFSQNGMSYMFHNIKNFQRESFGISFEYSGKSTKTNNKAFFSNVSIIGYSFININEVDK